MLLFIFNKSSIRSVLINSVKYRIKVKMNGVIDKLWPYNFDFFSVNNCYYAFLEILPCYKRKYKLINHLLFYTKCVIIMIIVVKLK